MNNLIARLAFGVLPLTHIATPLTAQTPFLLLNEVNPNIANSHDLIELFVVNAGNTGGFTIEQGIGTPVVLATLPQVNVAVGDIIVIHLNPLSTNGDAPSSETLSKSQFPNAVYPANYDAAWDFLGGVAGIPNTNRVLTVKDSAGTIQDAVPFTNMGTSPPSFPADLQFIQAQGIWRPINCGGVPCDYSSSPTAQAVSVNWTGAGITRTDTSVQRNSVIDRDTISDWVTSPQTWGILNQGQIVSVEKQDPIPMEFMLDQNYPNPCNPSTTIRFSVPHPEFVTLHIFNVLGEQIATLVSEKVSVGTHDVEWNAHDLPSGVYLYRLEAGALVQSKKFDFAQVNGQLHITRKTTTRTSFIVAKENSMKKNNSVCSMPLAFRFAPFQRHGVALRDVSRHYRHIR